MIATTPRQSLSHIGSKRKDRLRIFSQGRHYSHFERRKCFSMWRVRYTRIATLCESERPSSKDPKDTHNFDGRPRLACATTEFYRLGSDVKSTLHVGLMRIFCCLHSSRRAQKWLGHICTAPPRWGHNS